MSLKTWRRNNLVAAVLMMPLGVLMILFASVQLGAKTTRPPILVGGLGVVLIAVGATLVKFALAGPYPKAYRAEAEILEADD